MSFRFNWPEFDPTFYAEAKIQLETALNKEKKSKHIAGHIYLKELNMGTKPPELEILEICDLSTDYFRGIFKLTYRGDSSIALQTKIQANPLYNPPTYSPHYGGNFYPLPRHSRPDIVAAAQPLVIPMLLRISDVRLNGIIVLSVSKSKGITLVFKNDALESLLVSSTFDIVSSVKSFLQQQIESQLRTFLQDTLPLVVHEFSLRHINDQQQAELNQQQQWLQQTRTNQLMTFSTSTVPLSSESLGSLLQQQHYGNNNSIYHCSDSFTACSGINRDTSSIPDLTLSSAASECYSDASSENFSYASHGDHVNDFICDSIYEKHTNYNDATALQYPGYPMKETSTDYSSFFYDGDADCGQNQLCISALSSLSQTATSDDDTRALLEKSRHHYNRYTKPPSLFSSTTSLGSMSPPPPSPPSSIIRFNQPITLSQETQPHRLLQRMQHLSNSSQTLAAISEDYGSRASFIHKTGVAVVKPNEKPSRPARRKKIPRRRIIRWNP